MLESFLTTLQQMARILILLAIGYGFNKLRLIPRTAEPVLSKFVTMLFLPCLTLYSYATECDFQSLITYSRWTLFGCLVVGLSVGISFLLAGFFAGGNAYLKGVYRYALAIPNTGAVATPLVLAFFGTAGLFRYQMFTFAFSIVTYTWGIMQLQPAEGRHDLRFYIRRIFNANFVALLCGMVLGLTHCSEWMPSVVLNTVHDLSSCYVIVALLLTGFSIADYPMHDVVGNMKYYIFTLLRLIVLPCLFLVLTKLLRMDAMLSTMVVLSVSCPCGMNTVVYPAAYRQDCKPGASMVLISSIFSVVTVPLMYALASTFCG